MTEAQHRDRHRLPVGELRQRMRTVGGEEGGRIGTDCIEGDEAEIEQAGDADLEIEPHPHQDEEPDQSGAPGRRNFRHRAETARTAEGDGKRDDPADVRRVRRGISVDPRLDAVAGSCRRARSPIAATTNMMHRTLQLEAGIGVEQVMQRLGHAAVGEHRPDQLLEQPGNAAATDARPTAAGGSSRGSATSSAPAAAQSRRRARCRQHDPETGRLR